MSISIDTLRRAPNLAIPGSFGLIAPNIGSIHAFLNSVSFGGGTDMNALNTRMNNFIAAITPPPGGGGGGGGDGSQS